MGYHIGLRVLKLQHGHNLHLPVTQRKNVEVGVDIRYPPAATRLADYFLGLCFTGYFAPCRLA